MLKDNPELAERVARLEDIKSAEILTTQGLRMARSIPANLVFFCAISRKNSNKYSFTKHTIIIYD